MQYYSYEMFKEDIKELILKIDFNPDGIVAISRGGLTMAHFLGIALDLRMVYSINAASFFNRVQQEVRPRQERTSDGGGQGRKICTFVLSKR